MDGLWEMNPARGAQVDENHPLNEEDLSEIELMQLGEAWFKEPNKFEILSEQELSKKVNEARNKENKSTDDLLIIAEHAVRILVDSTDA